MHHLNVIKRKVVVEDSHRLGDFCRCPRRYLYSGIRKVEPINNPPWKARGAMIARMLRDYYLAKQNGGISPAVIQRIIDTILVPAEGVPDEMKSRIETRFMQYHKFYKNQDYDKIVAVEKPFSETLYSDQYVLFVYEGTPDMIVVPPFNQLTPVDHKHQTVDSRIYPYTHQFLGYCWAVKSTKFVTNIIGLQESGKPTDWFTRPVTCFSVAQIEAWRDTAIRHFYRILQARESKHFEKTYQCDTKYGVCEYCPLCETVYPWVVADKLKREYKLIVED